MIGRVRTALVALLVGVIALRWSVSQPASAATQRIAADPWAAILSAGEGWTYAGTLGGASVQGVRELPYAVLVMLGTDAGLSAPTVETCWRVLVLVLAVVGAVRLARGLTGIGRGDGESDDEPWTPWVGAVLFVLGAVLVPTLVRSPTDGLAAATLPWVVAPLLVQGAGWRPALGSAAWLGVAGVGSPVWALAAVGAGVVAALPRTRAGVVAFLRWLLLAAVASAWWLVLLVWERRHVVDVSSLVDAGLREGTAVAIGRSESSWAVLVVLTAGPLVVALGALCLRTPRLERRFVAGLLALTALGVLASVIADWRPSLAAPIGGEDPASPAGPLLGWLGLCGLVAWCPLVDDLRSRLRAAGRRELPALLVAGLVAVTALSGLAAAAAEPTPVPAAESQLLEEVADWSAEAAPGRVLVLPPGDGDTDLAALGGALGARPWVARDDVPTSGASGTAALDDLVTRLSRGDGGPGTLSALRRLGISYALVRLGGPMQEDRAHPSALVRAALSSAGARRVAVLRGDTDGAEVAAVDALVDFGVRSSVDQVEIWAPPATGGGWLFDGEPVDAVGDAGTVSDLADAGVLGDRAIRVRSASDEPSAVLSDSARRRHVDQRVPSDPYGPDLGVDEPRTTLPAGAAPVVSATRRVDGAASVTSSSSAADLDSALREAGTDAIAAIDANVFTAWQSRRGTGVGEWWEVVLDDPVSLSGAVVQFQQNAFSAHTISRVDVAVDGTTRSYDVAADGALSLDDLGETTSVRITVTGVEGAFGPGDSVGIVDVTIPGVTVTRPLVLSDAPAGAWLFGARLGSRTHCVPAVPRGQELGDPLGTACDEGLGVSGPDSGTLDRTLTVDGQTEVEGRAWLVAATTENAGALADRIAAPSVVATSDSAATRDLLTRPQAAADADPETAWRPALADPAPQLTLTWTDPADITGLRLLPPTGDHGSRPTRVRVAAGGLAPGRDLSEELDVAEDGTVSLPSVRTRQLTITFLEDTEVPTVESASGNTLRMPVAIGEVELLGGPAVTFEADRVEQLPCSEGPILTVGGVEHRTSLVVSAAQIVSGALVRASACDPITLPAGEVRVTMPATFVWQPSGLLLTGEDDALLPSGSGPVPVGADVWDRTAHGGEWSLDLDPADVARTLVLGLPAGAGWQASADGEPLESSTVDGWAQGWVVPAGAAALTVRYAPGPDVGRSALAASAGWVIVALLAAGATIRSRASRPTRRSRHPAGSRARGSGPGAGPGRPGRRGAGPAAPGS